MRISKNLAVAVSGLVFAGTAALGTAPASAATVTTRASVDATTSVPYSANLDTRAPRPPCHWEKRCVKRATGKCDKWRHGKCIHRQQGKCLQSKRVKVCR
jgi:hypothetical protein